MKGGYLLTNTPTNSLANLVNDLLTKKQSYIFLLENKYYEGNNIWATTILYF